MVGHTGSFIDWLLLLVGDIVICLSSYLWTCTRFRFDWYGTCGGFLVWLLLLVGHINVYCQLSLVGPFGMSWLSWILVYICWLLVAMETDLVGLTPREDWLVDCHCLSGMLTC